MEIYQTMAEVSGRVGETLPTDTESWRSLHWPGSPSSTVSFTVLLISDSNTEWAVFKS